MVEKCIVGISACQEKLYQQFYGEAMSICQRYSKTQEEAIAIYNTGFMKMFVAMTPYQDAQSFKKWLKRMMVTSAVASYHYHRENKSTRELNKMIQNIIPEEDSAKMRNKALMSLVQELSPPYRIVFNLFVPACFTHEEIAALLPISTGTSQNNLLTACTILHQRVRKSLPDKYWKYV